jgi:hypothetical protein
MTKEEFVIQYLLNSIRRDSIVGEGQADRIINRAIYIWNKIQEAK